MVIKERKCCSGGDFFKFIQRLKEAYSQNINEFIRNSSINGLRYFNQRDLTIGERLYFIVAFVAAVASSMYFIHLVAQKWSHSPTIISIEPRRTYITDDPFPAITICNMNQALKSRVSRFPTYSKEFTMLQTLCETKANSIMADAIYSWNSFGGFLLNVSQPCERMLLQCSFGGNNFNCSHIFRQVLRGEGLCCTFNSLDPAFQFVNGSKTFGFNVEYPPEFKPVAWSVEKGYQQPLPKYYYPMRAVGIGQSLGLNIILNLESDEYYCSSGNSIGFKIAVHDPNQEPTIQETGVLLSAGFESIVPITPRKVIAAKKLRQLDVKIRNCIFENEYNLTFFSHYSADNCLYECLVENMRSRCGCEPSYLISNNSKLAICTRKHRDCFVNIKANGTTCDKCWPNCFSKLYSTSVFSAKLENTGLDIYSPILSNMSIAYVQDNIAIVKFYFMQGVYECTKQAPYIGSIDVLSSIGGLISIFFGFSFISLAEFIYYICMRPLRSMISEKRSEKEVLLRKPCLRLANRPKTRFVNPYKHPSCKLKTQQSLALPRKVWYINAGNFSMPNQNGEKMQ